MKGKKLLLLLLVSVFLISTILTGCSNKEAQAVETTAETEAKGNKDMITYALWSSPTGVFNPVLFDEEYDAAVIQLTFDTLLKYDKDFNLVPSIAESYEFSQDNCVLTFKLKKNVKWHDDTPLTADDVAFTFSSLANPDYTGPRYGDVEVIKGAKAFHDKKADKVEGIKVLDDYTVAFEFEKPFAPALVRIGVDRGIIPKHVWEKVPVAKWAESTDLLNNPIGCGAYKLVKFEPGQAVELEAFDGYFDGAPKTKKFLFKVSNQDTAIAELINGDIDIADISALKKMDIEDLQSKGIKVTSYPGKSYQYMGFNLRDAKFQDKRVRQAITYAINRKLVVDKLLEGNGTMLNAPILPNGWAYPNDGCLNEYENNVEKAKELLKEAGWEDRNGDGVVENAKGESFKVSLKYPVGNKTREKSAPIIQANLKEIGIEVELINLEFGALLDEVMANHEFELYLLGSSLSLDPDPKPIWHSSAASDKKGDAAWNIAGFRNQAADALMDQGNEKQDIAERKAIYRDLCIMLNEEAPQVYLYAPNVVKAYNPNLQNFGPTSFLDYLDYYKWYVEQK